MNPTPAIGSYQYDLANGLAAGTSSSYTTNPNTGIINVPNASTISPTINANNIGLSVPYQLPTAPVNTTAEGIIAGTANGATQGLSSAEQAAKNVADLQKTQGVSEADTAQKNIIEQARQLLGQENNVYTNQAVNEKAQVDPQQKILNEINTDIANQNVAYRAEQDRIRQTPMSQAQAQVEQNNLADTYGRRLADLAIRQSAASQNIAQIQANFDRQTKLLIQPYENALKFQTDFAQKYADNLSAKESKQLDRVMSENNRLIQETQDLQKAKAAMVAEIAKNGGGSDTATIQAIQNAKDITEVASAGSKYVGKMDFLKSQADLAQTHAQTAKLKVDTQKIIDENNAKIAPATKAVQLAQAQTNISSVDSLLKDEAIRGAVGPSTLGRGFFGGGTIDSLTGAKQNFIAGIEQLRSQLNLDTLIKAKAQGATFGALSDQELRVLASAATRLGTWAITDKKTGQVTGYNVSEKEFKKELDKINSFSKLDYVLKGGKPTDVGVIVTDDGNMWSQNSDGSMTLLK